MNMLAVRAPDAGMRKMILVDNAARLYQIKRLARVNAC